MARITEHSQQQTLWRIVATITFTRLIINMTRRFVYPFVPAISADLNVATGHLQGVMAAQSATGLASPVFGPLGERLGRKRVMQGGLLLISLGAFLAAALPNFAVVALVLIVFGIGKMLFDPAMQSYLGDRIPYQRRGFALGITELSWAASLIIVAPLAGSVLDLSGLGTLFLMFGFLAFGVLVLITLNLPGDRPQPGDTVHMINPISALRIISNHPAALAALLYSMFLVMANEIFMINYGLWMEDSFDLSLAGLGVATMTIAVAEVAGEFLVIGLADRFGKRRVAMIATAISCFIYPLLPMLDSLIPALLGLGALFVFVETAIVASIPLFTEVLPDARAVMMSSNMGAHSLGRLVGAALGGWFYGLTNSFTMTGVLAMVLGMGAAVVMWRYVHENATA